MKRGTPEHPKVLMLANELGIKKYAAVGLLEMLWHFTARYAPRGDIGRFTDGIIGNSLDWGGNIPELMAALIKIGWLDKNNEYRLIVHDWSDHADDTCDKYLANHGLTYCDGREPRRKPDKGVKVRRPAEHSGKVRRTPEKSSLSEPVPVPEPVSKPEPLPVGEATTTAEDVFWNMGSVVERLKNIRPEFEQVRDVDWENALRCFPRYTWGPALEDFERDMLQARNAPNIPPKLFRGYLEAEMAGGRRGAAGQVRARVESAEEVAERAYAALAKVGAGSEVP